MKREKVLGILLWMSLGLPLLAIGSVLLAGGIINTQRSLVMCGAALVIVSLASPCMAILRGTIGFVSRNRLARSKQLSQLLTSSWDPRAFPHPGMDTAARREEAFAY
jgi:hypothetical protein